MEGKFFMENNLQIFNNAQFGEVRTMILNDEPYFVGKDIATILGYTDTSQAIRYHVDDEDKGGVMITTPGGIQEMTAINESGLYALVFGSKLPIAKQFKRWVTSEVLPSIRKHGMYATDTVIEQVLQNPDFGIKLLIELKDEREHRRKLELQNAQKEQIINELKPKADYTDFVLKNKSLVTINQIAKDYGMSGTEMNKRLHKLKVQYKQSGQWLLYSKHQKSGYTHSETIDIEHKDGRKDVAMHTKWTQKGRLFIYNLMKKQGILPLIERKEGVAQ